MNGRDRRRVTRQFPWARPVAGAFVAMCLLGLAPACQAASMLDPTGQFAVQWWTVDDGLPEPTVTGLDFAPDGSVICCTASHILRFDGSAFEPFDAGPVADLAATIGKFWSVAFDGDGRLWVQGSGAVARLDDRGGSRRWVVHRLREGTINSMSLGVDGRPVFVGPNLVLAWDGRNVVSLPMAAPAAGRVPWRYGIVDPGTDDLWLWGNEAEGRTLCRCRTPRDGGAPLVVEPVAADVAAATVTLGRTASGVCALLKDSAAVHDADGWRRLEPRFPDAEHRASGKVAQGRDGTVWISTPSGLVACRDGRVEGTIEGLPGFPAFAYRLALDRHGGAWAACSGGLLAVRRTTLQPIAINDCRAVCPRADGSLLVGTAGSVAVLPTPAPGLTDDPHPQPLAALPKAAIPTAIVEDVTGRIWVGTQDSFILRMDRDGGNLERVTRPDEHYRELRSVTALAVDAGGRVWAGTSNGLAVHAAARDVFTPVLGFGPRDRAFVVGLAADADGGVLVASLTRGVERVAADGRVTPLLPVGDMPGRRTVALARDAAGSVWIGGDRGLVRVDAAGGTARYTAAQGLVDEAVRQIAPDALGRLWIGTRDGHLQGVTLAALDDVAEGRATRFRGHVLGPLDGLGEAECTGRVAATSGAGGAASGIVVPLADGVVRFDPASAIDRAAAGTAPWIERTPGDPPAFRFGVTGLHWGDPPLVQTLLVGIDPDWSPPVASARRVLATAPPGRHELRVRLLRGETDRDFPTAASAFDVPAPWWQRGWFAAAVVTATAATAALLARDLTRRRARRRIADLERQQAMDRERARIARDIHDSIGAGLTRVALASDLARRAGSFPDAVGHRLDAISAAAHGLARSIDEIVWAVNPGNDTLGRFVSYVVNDVEEAARAGDLALHLDVPGDLPEDLPLPTQARHHLCLAVREALQNVLRHAAAGRVEFAVHVADDEIAVTVADDGAGFVADGPRGPGADGIDNMRERLVELGGAVRIHSAPGRGTRVVFTAPLRPAAGQRRPIPARSPPHAGHAS